MSKECKGKEKENKIKVKMENNNNNNNNIWNSKDPIGLNFRSCTTKITLGDYIENTLFLKMVGSL
jgi:hypothetical protein